MLDTEMRDQLRAYLQRLQQPIELVSSLDDSPNARDVKELVEEIAQLSDKVAVRHDGTDARKPSFQITRAGQDMGVRFAALPMGHEFTSLVLALLWAGGHPPKFEPELIEQIRNLEGEYRFETYMSLTCHNCPDVVQALNLMAIVNPRITHVAIDGGYFPQEIADRQIMGVPTVFLNGEMFGNGRMELGEIVAKIDKGAAARDAKRLSGKQFDVLIVGAGPAGAAAAIYAARKGVRTGIVAERFGGQTLDTLAIDNFVSVQHTEGPQYAAALEAHVRDYDVDIMKQQRVAKVEPAAQAGGYARITLDNGAVLTSRTVILATGARWRNLGVPGENEYKTKGVAYCPHCDGPLYKGKKVAVIGGGNSGIEAAIDLAGVVDHVTVYEFMDQLKADSVLVDKLESLPNVDVHLNAQTTEVIGDGTKVTGLVHKDRASGDVRTTELAGVFVQIGLVPSTEFLKDGPVERTKFGEIVVDARGATNVPGIFAAGDATTAPYKQIIVAAGDGAKAALSAFDFLIRNPEVQDDAATTPAQHAEPATA